MGRRSQRVRGRARRLLAVSRQALREPERREPGRVRQGQAQGVRQGPGPEDRPVRPVSGFGQVHADGATADRRRLSSWASRARPSFFINDWLVLGALPVEEFDSYIAKAKAGQKPPPTPTPLPQGVEFWQPDPKNAGRTYDGSYYMGDAKAPVVILAFEDFKSPESAEHAKSVEPKLKSDYIDKGLARYVVQLYPLERAEGGCRGALRRPTGQVLRVPQPPADQAGRVERRRRRGDAGLRQEPRPRRSQVRSLPEGRRRSRSRSTTISPSPRRKSRCPRRLRT